MPDGTLIVAVPPCDITSTAYTITSNSITNSAGLTTAEPSDFATLPNLDPLKCYLKAVSSALLSTSIPLTAHGCAGVRLPELTANSKRITRRQAFYRTVTLNSSSASLPITSTLPSAVTAGSWGSTGTPSASTMDDDPYTGGSTAYYTGSSSTGAFLVDFATPSEVASGNKQIFAVQVKAASGGTTLGSKFTIDLYESGSLVRSLRTVYIPPGNGLVTLVALWDIDELATGTGANAQLGINVLTAETVQVHRARWYSCQSVSNTLFDSGFKPLGYYDEIDGSMPQPQLSHLEVSSDTPTITTFAVVHLYACDALTDMSSSYSANDVLRVGRIWGSGHIQPANGPGPGSSVTVEDASTSGETVGGQTTGNVGARRRVANLSLPMLTGPEAATLAWRLDYGSGKLNPFMVSILPDDDDFRAWGCLYCTMEPDGITFPSSVIRSRTMRLREKL